MRSKLKRPFGVKILILLQLFILITLGIIAALVFILDKPDTLKLLEGGDIYIVLSLSLKFSGLVIIHGLWRLKRWAWIALMIQLGLSMILDLALYFEVDQTSYLSMLLNVVMVFYLAQDDVQVAFFRAQEPR